MLHASETNLAARSPRIPNFEIEKCIFQLKTTYISFFSHTLTAPIASPPATMLQVVTAFFHSWPIATCLFDSTGKRGSYLETMYLYTYWLLHHHRWKLKERWEFVQLNCNHDSVNTLCFLSSSVFDISINVTKPLKVQTVVQSILSLFSGIILLLNGWDV